MDSCSPSPLRSDTPGHEPAVVAGRSALFFTESAQWPPLLCSLFVAGFIPRGSGSGLCSLHPCVSKLLLIIAQPCFRTRVSSLQCCRREDGCSLNPYRAHVAGATICVAGRRWHFLHCFAPGRNGSDSFSVVVQVWRRPGLDDFPLLAQCKDGQGLRALPWHIIGLARQTEDPLAIQRPACHAVAKARCSLAVEPSPEANR